MTDIQIWVVGIAGVILASGLIYYIVKKII